MLEEPRDLPGLAIERVAAAHSFQSVREGKSDPMGIKSAQGLTVALSLVVAMVSVLLPVPAIAQTKTQAGTQAGQPANASLQKRIEQLEEQIVDLQVVIGTLESLAKTGGHGSGNSGLGGRGGGGNADSGRLRGVETQINALTAQVERLAGEVAAMQGRPSRVEGFREGSLGPSPLPSAGQGRAPASPSAGGGFGATTVTPSGEEDAIGGLIQQATQEPPAPLPANAPPVGGTDSPQDVYDTAYGHLLQQNYKAAQDGFRDFLRRFPDDKQVPNALYWLGETYYVQQNYADAAEAFDIVTAAYASSNKAPDSQLKRAMSLANLGKRNEACSAFRSLSSRYPNAPDYVKSKADSESQRVGCS